MKTETSSQMYRGSQCKGFANWVFLQIFDVYIGPYPENAVYRTNASTADVIGELAPGYLNENSCRELLQKGLPGDFIQVLKDTVLMQRYLLGMVSLNAQQLECADYNNDGKFSLADIVAVQRYIM